jgi:hypothetical protein
MEIRFFAEQTWLEFQKQFRADSRTALSMLLISAWMMYGLLRLISKVTSYISASWRKPP